MSPIHVFPRGVVVVRPKCKNMENMKNEMEKKKNTKQFWDPWKREEYEAPWEGPKQWMKKKKEKDKEKKKNDQLKNAKVKEMKEIIEMEKLKWTKKKHM